MCGSITGVGKRYFFTPKLATGSGTHAVSCSVGAGGFSLGGGIKHPYVFVAFAGTHIPFLDIISLSVKGKVIPITGLCGPEGG